MPVKLSIITINYNNSAGLKRTVESVTQQTFSDFEYLIIDGGSSDNSLDIIKKNTDKITYWVSEKDKGIYNALNKGILQAKGEYLYFLNSGDSLYQTDTLNNVFSVKQDTSIIYGNMLKQYNNKGFELDKSFQRSSLTLSDLYFHNLNHQATFIKKSLFCEFGLYNENYAIVADWLFFLRTIGLAGVSVKYMDETVSNFDTTGISSTQIELRNKERVKAINELLPKSIILDYEELNTLRNRVVVLDNIKKRKSLYLAFKLLKKMFL